MWLNLFFYPKSNISTGEPSTNAEFIVPLTVPTRLLVAVFFVGEPSPDAPG